LYFSDINKRGYFKFCSDYGGELKSVYRSECGILLKFKIELILREVFVILIENSVFVKSRPNEQVKYYLASLDANKENKKQRYAACIGSLVRFLENKRINQFEDLTKTDIDDKGFFQASEL